MSLILVICKDSSFRRFFVDNFVIRGLVAVGMSSLQESTRMLMKSMPDLILMCCEPEVYEAEMDAAPMISALDSIPLVLCSREHVDPRVFQRWKPTGCITYPADARELMNVLRPWLSMSI